AQAAQTRQQEPPVTDTESLFTDNDSEEQEVRTKRKIRFQYRNSRPMSVSVLGEFSDWEPIPMEKGANHTWTAVVEIEPGEYLYCFDVDGNLIPDPYNSNLRILSGNEKRSLLKVKPLP
ncbi:MAG: hypothetical protein GF384_03505, partial [Elusimicrobia bacterium]|nr:hypothetical protein [Elusimicrobiota bacterium]MBD3411980.1 hypothetical protein [Elusimicrobiota bacterium]